MINYYQNTKGNKLQKLAQFKPGTWIQVEEPSEEDIKLLSEKFNLEYDLLKDSLDLYEVPRLEKEAKRLYIFTRFPHDSGTEIITSPMLIIVDDRFILTISPESPMFIEVFLNMRKPLHTNETHKALLQIMLQINSAYNAYLTKISRKIRSLEIRVEKINNKDIITFVSFEGMLNDFRPSILRLNAILESLMTRKYITFHESDKDIIEDIVLSNKQLIELTDDSITTIRNIREAYTAIMTNNLNRVIKILTSLTVVFTIPTMVASLYGMNVKLPLQDHPMSFWIILLGITIISGVTMYVFLNKDYF